MNTSSTLRQFLTLLLFGAAAFGCSSDANPAAPELDARTVLLPLTAGNDWLYQFTAYDPNGSVSFTGPALYKISKDTSVAGATWSLLVRQTPTFEITAYRNDTSGLRMTDFRGTNVWFRYPGKRGDTYDEGVLETPDSLIITPTAAYHCYVYKSELNGVVYRHMYAPGVGRVRDEIVSVTGSKTYISLRMELYLAHINYSATN